MARFDLRSLAHAVVQAPMAGGPSTPALAAAVSEVGALGFLAGGYLSAAQVAHDIAATRELTDAPFGVNLFVPQPSVADAAQLEAYRDLLEADAARLGVEPGQPHPDDDGYPAKLEVVLDARPAVVSFTFGAPNADVVERLHGAGIAVAVTVTTVAEARSALTEGADILVAQGEEAGGHRGTFDPGAAPSPLSAAELVGRLRETGAPIVAAGGAADAAAAVRLRAAGASAVQAGTAFLLAHEAGTKPAHAAALVDPRFTRTIVTTAFSGRPARGVENGFVRAHDAAAPLGYPEVNQITSPLRAAAAAAADVDGVSAWAGVRYRDAFAASAADIVRTLAGIAVSG